MTSRAGRLLHAGPGEVVARTVNPPVQRGSTVLIDRAADLYREGAVSYGLAGLATHDALKAALCELEGASAVELFPSGLAALTAPLLALLSAGDEVLVADSVYGPTRRFCDVVLPRYGIASRYYAPAASAEEVMALASPATRMIVLESPGSLTFEVQDAPAIAAAARSRGVLTLMDNTWAAGWWFRPLEHGVDVSMQALTKYPSGGSDVMMGSVAVSDPSLAKRLNEAVWDFGWAVSADEAYTVLRSIRTLPTRMAQHDASAREIAAWLQGRPEVLRVLHPALSDDAGHALWRRDFTGAAGLFGVVLRPASGAAVNALLDTLELFGLGFSWGGFESLAIPCDIQLKRRSPPLALGGPLIRVNVGLEPAADLIADLDRGLAAFGAAGG